MKLLEYRAKEIFRKYGIPVPHEILATSVEEVVNNAKVIGFPVVIKAQVGVGGRGKAGGVKIARDEKSVIEIAGNILGMTIKGEKVKKVLVSQAIDIGEELYLGITVDRKRGEPVVISSASGGIDIEEIARTSPEKIKKIYINPLTGILPYQMRQASVFLTDDKDKQKQIQSIVEKLFDIFDQLDGMLVEINPLVFTKSGEIIALDAKIIIDDNGLYRHPDIESMRELDESTSLELEAKAAGLSYIKLDGNVGCIVNGAGLAMATMDIIKKYGAEPANFLDIGGSSRPEKMEKAMEMILRDKNVKAIFINIFGGITRCDDVARGLIEVKKSMKIDVPVVIRLTGTNEDIAREMLKDTDFFYVDTMSKGAEMVVKLARGE